MKMASISGFLFPGFWSCWVPNQQIIQWSGNGSIALNEAAIVARKSEEFTDILSALRDTLATICQGVDYKGDLVLRRPNPRS